MHAFSNVHKLVSHTKPVSEEDIAKAEEGIKEYMKIYRSHPNSKIIPKQHMLECHAIDFMKEWGFGLALHGEQGGEDTHHVVNDLKPRVRCIRNNEKRIAILIREHMTKTSPVLQSALPCLNKKK